MSGKRDWIEVMAKAVLVIAVLAAGVAAFVFLRAGSDDLEKAQEACAEGGQPVLGDEGQTLTITSDGGKRKAFTATAVSACVLAELDAPDSLMSKVEQTTALMGRQSDSWEDYELTWTYHPDDGLELIIEIT